MPPHTRRHGAPIAWALTLAGAIVSLYAIPGLRDAMRAREGVDALLTHWPWMIGVLLVLAGSGRILARMPADQARLRDLLAPGATILVLHAVPVLAWPTARTFTAWLHAGFADYFTRGGVGDSAIDVRFSWPAAFGWIGQFAEASGLETLDFARLWPVAIQLAAAAAVAALAGALGANRKVRLTAAWLWALTSFIGQDYMSPQSLNLFLYLAALAQTICYADRADDRRAFGLAVLFSVATVVSHPLTPMVLVATTVALCIALRGSRHIWRLAAVQLAAEIVYISVWGRPAIERNDRFRSEIGDLGTWLGSNLTDRLDRATDTARLLILVDRLAITTTLVLGASAVLLHIRRRNPEQFRAPFALLVAPLPVTLLIPYGGEIFLRGALFTAGIATIVLGWWLTTRPRAGRVLPLVGIIAGLMFIPARWGNDTFERFDEETVAAVEWAIENSDTDDLLINLDFSAPIRHREYETRNWRMLEVEQLVDADQLARIFELGTGKGYVILSEDSAVSRMYVRGAPADLFETVLAELEAHPRFRRVLGEPGDTTQVFAPIPRGQQQGARP